MRDKPGKPVDFYHTCYCLAGLGVTQHGAGGRGPGHGPDAGTPHGPPPRGALRRSDPLCNVVCDRLAEARAFYGGLPRVPWPGPDPAGYAGEAT